MSLRAIPSQAKDPEFQYKYHHDLPVDSPVHVRSFQLWEQVFKETGGRLKVTVFPNNALGSDASALVQIREGALEFMAIPAGTLSSVVNVASIEGVAFAFSSAPTAQAADDGDLGEYIRKEAVAKGVILFRYGIEIGFRQMITSTRPVRNAEDMAGLKVRVPSSKLTIDFLQTLGAAPTQVDTSALYAALQTKLVDGAELPLSSVAALHLNEVQRFLSLTNHAWYPVWVIASPAAWGRLPSDIQETVRRNIKKYAGIERRDVAILDPILQEKLGRQGMSVNRPDTATFRAKLGPYYRRWKQEFGPAAWDLLERYSGRLS